MANEYLLFIYLVKCISPSSIIQNQVHKFSSVYNEICQDFTHILPNFPSPFPTNMLFNTMVWSLTKHKDSQRHSRGNSQNAGLATNQYLKISIPFLGDFTKCFQFPQLFQTSDPSHRPNYGSKGI